jgi:hypothetical protein
MFSYYGRHRHSSLSLGEVYWDMFWFWGRLVMIFVSPSLDPKLLATQ